MGCEIFFFFVRMLTLFGSAMKKERVRESLGKSSFSKANLSLRLYQNAFLTPSLILLVQENVNIPII